MTEEIFLSRRFFVIQDERMTELMILGGNSEKQYHVGLSNETRKTGSRRMDVVDRTFVRFGHIN